MPTTLAMNIPYGMVMVPVNETMRKILNPSGEYNISVSMISGGVAGAIAAALTNPLDVIKTRLQTQNLEPCPKMKFSTVVIPSIKAEEVKSGIRGAIEIAKHIYRSEGMIGFSRGIVPRIFTQIPSVAVSWSAYEFVKNLLSQRM